VRRGLSPAAAPGRGPARSGSAIVALVLVATLAAPRLGLAAEDAGGGRAETVAVLDSIIDGVPASAKPAFEQNLEESLRGAGFTVLPQATVRNLLVTSNATAGCSFGPCLRAVGKALGVELALVVRISADGPSFTFVLTLVDTSSGAPVAQVSDTCAVCTFDEASSAATIAVVDLGMKYRDARNEAVAVAKIVEHDRREAQRVHQSTWLMGSLALVAGGAAAYLLLARDDHADLGWAAAGGAAGLAIGTIATF
jgi:hypothetical protein